MGQRTKCRRPSSQPVVDLREYSASEHTGSKALLSQDGGAPERANFAIASESKPARAQKDTRTVYGMCLRDGSMAVLGVFGKM